MNVMYLLLSPATASALLLDEEGERADLSATSVNTTLGTFVKRGTRWAVRIEAPVGFEVVEETNGQS